MVWPSSALGNRPCDRSARHAVSPQGEYPPLLSVSLPGCDGEPFFANFCICHTSKKCAGNSFPCHTSKNTRFKTLCLPHIQKMTGVGGILLTWHATSMPALPAPDFSGSDRRERQISPQISGRISILRIFSLLNLPMTCAAQRCRRNAAGGERREYPTESPPRWLAAGRAYP